jgi:ATP-dependent Clp protease, protease subunit
LVYVSFSAEIDATTTENLIGVMTECMNKKVEQVYLLLSSPGGSVMHGFNLYNILKGMPFKLITHNVGNVDSIGNMVFLAGEERYACPNAIFMFHGVGQSLPQNTRLEEKDIREKLDSLTKNNKRIGDIIAEHSKLDDKKIASLFLQANTLNAQEALNGGIIHDIRDVSLVSGNPVVSLVFKR